MAVVDVGLHCLLRLPQASAPEELPAIGAASAQLHRLGTQEALGLGPHLCLRVDISSFSDQGGCSLPSTLGFCFVLFCVVETGSHVTQAGLIFTVFEAGLECLILLPESSKCWGYRYATMPE